MKRRFKIGDKRELVRRGPVALMRVAPRSLARGQAGQHGQKPYIDLVMMVDTGSFATFVEEHYLQALGIRWRSTTEVINVSQTSERRRVYPVRVSMEATDERGVPQWHGLDLDVVGAPKRMVNIEYDGLIGRDFLAACNLEYEGLAGAFTLTFFGDWG